MREKTGSPLILGLAVFEKISAVEGVRLPEESRRMFADFDRKGLTRTQRRAAIEQKHSRKA